MGTSRGPVKAHPPETVDFSGASTSWGGRATSGGLSERPKEMVLKTIVRQRTKGSNPLPSASFLGRNPAILLPAAPGRYPWWVTGRRRIVA